MSIGVRADSRDRAREVRAFLRARRTRWRPTAYQVYATLLMGAIAGALGGHAVSGLIGGSLDAHKLVTFGPAVLILGRVGPTHCCAGPPSEPGRARFRAPGSSKPV